MYEEMALAGLPEPSFKSLDGAVVVRLENNIESRTLRKERDLTQKIREDVFLGLGEKEKMVVLYCLENKTISTSECTTLIKQSDDTALNLLNKEELEKPASTAVARDDQQQGSLFDRLRE